MPPPSSGKPKKKKNKFLKEGDSFVLPKYKLNKKHPRKNSSGPKEKKK